eukprot:Trichotokara_eunicae@DN5665_c0_g1_i1.p1
MLVSPQLWEGRTTVDAYFPAAARWYDFYTGLELASSGMHELPTDVFVDNVPVHFRGGYVIPGMTQGEYLSLTAIREAGQPFEYYVNLDELMGAEGHLFWDDGDSVDTVEKNEYSLVEFKMWIVEPSVQENVDEFIFSNTVTRKHTSIDIHDVDFIQVNGVTGQLLSAHLLQYAPDNCEIVSFTTSLNSWLIVLKGCPAGASFSIGFVSESGASAVAVLLALFMMLWF